MCPASLSDLLALFNSYVKHTFNLTGESVKKNGRFVCWLCCCCQSACSDWRAAELTVMKCCIDFGFAVQCADTLLVTLQTQQTDRKYRTTDSIGQRRAQHTDSIGQRRTQYSIGQRQADSIGQRRTRHTVSDNDGYNRHTVPDNDGHNRHTVSDNDGHNRQADSIGQRRTQQVDTRLCAHFGCKLTNTGV